MSEERALELGFKPLAYLRDWSFKACDVSIPLMHITLLRVYSQSNIDCCVLLYIICVLSNIQPFNELLLVS